LIVDIISFIGVCWENVANIIIRFAVPSFCAAKLTYENVDHWLISG